MENKLEDLCFYTKLAKKTISAFANNIYSGLSQEMLANDETVGEVANAIMIGDWRWDKNRKGKTGKSKTRYSYRNQCAIWAIQTYATKKYKKKKLHSLEYSSDPDDNEIKSHIPGREKEPISIIIEKESSDNIKYYLNEILQSDVISERQRKFIQMYYYDSHTLESIGKQFNITKEAVRQNIKKAIENIKNVVNV
tara:strand:- start:7036 stop:7620 length:585 start_codon:yes stop_codon:yes gene_type:complete